MKNLFESKTNARSTALCAAALLCALTCAALSGCGCLSGYQIGPSGMYDGEIKTVYVPMVEANTYRDDFGERLTEAIVKKITEQTPYRIGSAGNADSILTVKLTGETQKVSAVNRYDDTRQKNVELTATAVWTDVRGVARRKNKNTSSLAGDARNPDDGANLISQSFLVPEMGQSTATAQQEAIDKLAEEIVGLMENAW